MVNLWLKRGAGGGSGRKKVNYLLALFCLKLTLNASVVTAMELPPELLQHGSSGNNNNDGNLLKSKSVYSPFPLAADVDVELPLDVDVDDAISMTQSNENDMADMKLQQSLPPWLQMTHNEPQQKQRISSGTAKAFIKMPPAPAPVQHQHQHQPHKHAHTHTHGHGSGNGIGIGNGFNNDNNDNGERRCSIEISSKIPGVCQPMSHIGSACVSGEYMEVFNADCM